MPISIRTLSEIFSAASYRFPRAHANSVVQDWPWLRVPSGNTKLCDICSQLNFQWLFQESLAGFKVSDGVSEAQLTDGICLGLYGDVAQRSNCTFCQLLVHTLEVGAHIDMLNYYDDWPRREIWLQNHALTESGQTISFEAWKEDHVVRLDVRLKAEDDEKNVIFSTGGRTVMIQQIRDSPGQELAHAPRGRAVDQNTEGLVDTIQQWIRPCLDNYVAPSIQSEPKGLASIRLIDTANACIVGPLQRERYVALSYTWGKIDPLVLLKNNEADLREEGALIAHKSRLPITIYDSIQLCKMLGERYLWCDSLCIMQNTSDKHDQIQQMDLIYQGAVLCIVAAAGLDANAGLPGISRERKMRQHIVEVDDMKLANTLWDVAPSVEATFWRSRGWCFQEDLLSTRKLIFTPQQTYFQCPHRQCNEDTHCVTHSLDLTPNRSSQDLNMENTSNWNIYKNLVAEYSACHLSFEADMLNAFAGIACYLSKSVYRGCPLVMGIPFCSIEVGILWHPATRLRRRSGTNLPSWSWVGWVGMISYADEDENIFERTISRIQWDIGVDSDEPSQIMTCLPPQSWAGWKGWKRHAVGQLNQVHYTHVDLPSTRWFSHPILQQQWPIKATTPLLHCTADVVSLKLTGEHTDSWYQECTEDVHEICYLKVFDRNGHQAGVVVMDGATYEKTAFAQASFAFMKVSQTTLRFRGDPAWDEESKSLAGKPGEPAINTCGPVDPGDAEFDQDVYDGNICWCMYNVLVVEFEGDVARRIAVGRVHITAFDNAHPERKSFKFG